MIKRTILTILLPTSQGLSRIFGRFTPHRPEEPVLGKPKAQHRLFTAPSTACLRRCEKSRRFSPPKILDRPEVAHCTIDIWWRLYYTLHR